MAALQFVVMRTRFGRAMRAVSFDAPAAALMGVPVDRVILGTFVLGSALAAAAGILVGLSNPKIDPLMGVMPGLKAFVAAVLGGIGNIPGAMVGGLLLGVLETLVVRLPLEHLPRRDRLRGADRDPALPPDGPVRRAADGEGVRGRARRWSRRGRAARRRSTRCCRAC